MHEGLVKIRRIIFKHSLFISFSIVIVSFLFSRLPFFLWAPIPEFFPDTFDYFYYIERLKEGILPSFEYLPQGFGFFVHIVGLISNKIIAVIYAQNIIILLSSLYFIKVINKHYSNLSILCSIGLSIYLMDSYVIRLDTGLITESIYTSSMILICGLFINAVNSKNKIKWLLFSASLILPAIIRSNGLYIYFLPFWLIFYMVINKYSFKFYLYLLLPFISLNLIWMIYNRIVDNNFHIPYSARIDKVYKSEISIEENNKINFLNKTTPITYKQHKFNLFINYLFNIRHTKPQFYYTFINDRYRNLYINDQPHDMSFRMFNGTKFLPQYLRLFTYREYYKIDNDKFHSLIYQFDVKK